MNKFYIKMFIFLIVLTLVMFFFGCSKQIRVKNFGGSETITLGLNQKLVNVTWKDSDMWVLTRPMKNTDSVETYIFSESSSFGVFEGTLTIKEIKK
jgi:hypothetical protein